MPKCRYCNENFSPKVIVLHEARCKQNPDNQIVIKKKTAAKKTEAKSEAK